jgi:hypothetical protein
MSVAYVTDHVVTGVLEVMTYLEYLEIKDLDVKIHPCELFAK